MNKYFILVGTFVALIVGCGGDAVTKPVVAPSTSATTSNTSTGAIAPQEALDAKSEGAQEPTVVYDVGIFFDAEVAGLAYECTETEGVTDSDGSFEYLPGDDCSFALGENSYEVDTANVTEGVVTPFDLTDTEEEGIELARVIQSVSEEDANGVLVVAQDTAKKLDKINLKDPEATQKAIEKIGAKIVKIEDAIAHLKENFDLDAKNAGRVTLKIATLERVKSNKEKIKNAREKALALKDDAQEARADVKEARAALQEARDGGDADAIAAAKEALQTTLDEGKEVKADIIEAKAQIKEEIQEAKDDTKAARDEAKAAKEAAQAEKAAATTETTES